MTVDEVKSLLNTIGETFAFIEKDYSQELSDSIREGLGYLIPDVVKMIAISLEISEERVNQIISDFRTMLDGFDKVFLTDEASKIVDFCDNLQNRPLILRFLAWNLR